ncbi:MAG: TIGR04222 domain-containing membrane protein [Phycisphaerae bacterium]
MPKQTHKVVEWLAGMMVTVLAPTTGAAMAWPWPDRHRDLTGTWLDTFNFLDLIPGPPFLLFFILYAALVVLGIKLLVRWWVPRVEGASLLDLGEQVHFELKPSYLELAYLKGGRKAAVEAALCNLHRLRVVSAYLSKRTREIRPVVNPQLHGLERAVAAACEEGTSAHALIYEKRVVRALASFEAAARSKLRMVGLLAARPTYLTALGAIVLALMLVDGLGLIRLARSVMRGYTNIGLLLALILATVPLIIWGLKPRLTRAGARYLRLAKAEYLPLARRVQARMHPWDAPEVLYAVAVCGAGTLDGTDYATIHAALQPPRTPGGSGGGECGGGGCGGGGCGGGGCGGGGCGGG